ncbi:MAG: hypothetical protein WD046_09540 [Paracoccaceae bacterium]
MKAMLKQLWRNNKLLVVAFLIALSITGYFGTRFVASSIYWANPAHRDVHIEGWMTPGYVARSYRVSPRIVEAALGLDSRAGRGRTMAEIAMSQGKSLDNIRANIVAAAIAARNPRSGEP